jgi:hypothetical protein
MMSTDIHAIDDLIKALCKGDPNETVPLNTVTAMAAAAIRTHWIECTHEHWNTERAWGDPIGQYTKTCELCGAQLIVEPEAAE